MLRFLIYFRFLIAARKYDWLIFVFARGCFGARLTFW